MDSRTKFYLTDKEDQIIFNAGISSQRDDPPGVIYSYDLINKKTRILTPDEIHCRKIYFLAHDKVCFSAYNIINKKKGIYEMNLNGKQMKLLFDDAVTLTMRAEN